MIVYKVVTHDFHSNFIAAPGWRVRYELGKVARGQRRPGRHRTPLFAFANLADARCEAQYQGRARILRCYTPSARPIHWVWNARSLADQRVVDTLARFWATPVHQRQDFNDCFHGGPKVHIPDGVLCPSLLPIEEVEK